MVSSASRRRLHRLVRRLLERRLPDGRRGRDRPSARTPTSRTGSPPRSTPASSSAHGQEHLAPDVRRGRQRARPGQRPEVGGADLHGDRARDQAVLAQPDRAPVGEVARLLLHHGEVGDVGQERLLRAERPLLAARADRPRVPAPRRGRTGARPRPCRPRAAPWRRRCRPARRPSGSPSAPGPPPSSHPPPTAPRRAARAGTRPSPPEGRGARRPAWRGRTRAWRRTWWIRCRPST